jgi:4-hydroxybenzoate polyprenyltransferase
MRVITGISRFFIYSNIFIAACAVLMANQTYSFLLHISANSDFLFFVFFSTICSYSFHWWLTSHSVIPSSRMEWLKINRKLHIVFFFAGLIGAGIFFFYLLPYWHWLFFSAIITFLYSAPKIPTKHFQLLRRVALGKTIFLALVWMYVTTVLPIIISPVPWQNHFLLFIASRFFLIYAICILFDYRDREDDKAAGIRSMITYLSERGIFYLFISSLIIFAIVTIWMLEYNYRIIDVAILLLPGVITVFLYNYAIRNFSDRFYYFVLDGLMALSAMLMLFPGI